MLDVFNNYGAFKLCSALERLFYNSAISGINLIINAVFQIQFMILVGYYVFVKHIFICFVNVVL